MANHRSSTSARIRWHHQVGAGAILLMGAGSAPAQEKSLAEGLFRSARQEMRRGDYRSACPKLDESYRLDPTEGTLLNQAVCEERLGHTATAWTKYLRFVETAAAGDNRVDLVKKRIRELEPHLPRLRIAVIGAPPDALVFLDDIELQSGSIGVDMPVDAGEHRARLIGPNGTRAEEAATVANDQQVEIRLIYPMNGDTTPAKTPSMPSSKPVSSTSASTRPFPAPTWHSRTKRASRRSYFVAGFTAAGIGAAGFTSAAIFTALSSAKKPAVSAHCTERLCDSEGLRAADQGRALLRAGDVGLVVGALGVVMGSVLLFEAWRMTPVVSAGAGIGFAGVAGAWN